MTQNVVAYLSQQEAVRSNQAREAETTRHNVESERLAQRQHMENVRHNAKTEYLNAQNLILSEKTLQHQQKVLEETSRSNRAQEALTSQRNLIQERYNTGSLAETSAHNRASERLSEYSTNVSASTQRYVANVQSETAIKNQQLGTSGSVFNKLLDTGVNLLKIGLSF